MKRYFITGTDTDCGKTYVTRQLLDAHPNSVALKPVASGCVQTEEGLVSSDALILQEGTGLSLQQINPWRFKAPVSPHIAAEQVGVSLSISEIAEYCLGFQMDGIENVFIEGAGGLIVPLNHQETWLDFLKLTRIPVILVVGMKLGCINHALLTVTALKVHGIECVGWVANCLDSEMEALEENIATLENRIEFPRIVVAGDE